MTAIARVLMKRGICAGCEGPCATWEEYCYPCRQRANETLLLKRGETDSVPSTPCIYVVSVSGTDGAPVKFGFSLNPKQRLYALQIGSPVKLEIIASCDGPRRLENMIHRTIRDERLHGEWFARSPRVAEIVGYIAEQRGEELLAKLRLRKRTIRHL